MTLNFQTLADDLAFLDDWEDRFKYVIDLGKDLPPLDPSDKTDASKVRGCASQVWLVTEKMDNGALKFRGESDAFLVSGLVAVILALYSDKSPAEILAIDPKAELSKLNLEEHLTPQRSNGLYSMVARIRADAENAGPLLTD